VADIGQNERELLAALRRGDRVIAVHYACENFYTVKDRPVAISSIACSEASNSGDIRTERVFSLANSGSLASGDAPEPTLIEREKNLLDRFMRT
jgi:hypothetical protein